MNPEALITIEPITMLTVTVFDFAVPLTWCPNVLYNFPYHLIIIHFRQTHTNILFIAATVDPSTISTKQFMATDSCPSTVHKSHLHRASSSRRRFKDFSMDDDRFACCRETWLWQSGHFLSVSPTKSLPKHKGQKLC